ncbi:hypothetical protein [Rheinheimera baltica]|uniref:hypothetical protein n=1 Tax=Rheinheimera baltica TaxID=67576 RepID=UPI000407C065|nr:hypothetical protein [Rheinheimera baltica]MDP5144496.1 hypothetical protein [Rheinheimera baltica]MDP5149100.1 hypothetical protein [Rheinheimera baltica]MDP5190401.1 hypothetical protein [Rheinheimera baltica]
MLINAVLVYTRELLPVLLLVALILRIQRSGKRKLLLQSAAMSLLLMLLLAPWLGDITQLAEGNGLELLFVAAHGLTLLALMLFAGAAKWHRSAAIIALSAQAVLCGINLLLYGLTSHGSHEATESIWLGATLGVGIGLSIAVLWYQLLAELDRFGFFVLALMTGFIAARQSSAIVALLGQIDWVSSGQVIWDSGQLINEQSEVGVFIQAWFGYEATPDALQLSCWILTLVLMTILWQWRRPTQ